MYTLPFSPSRSLSHAVYTPPFAPVYTPRNAVLAIGVYTCPGGLRGGVRTPGLRQPGNPHPIGQSRITARRKVGKMLQIPTFADVLKSIRCGCFCFCAEAKSKCLPSRKNLFSRRNASRNSVYYSPSGVLVSFPCSPSGVSVNMLCILLRAYVSICYGFPSSPSGGAVSMFVYACSSPSLRADLLVSDRRKRLAPLVRGSSSLARFLRSFMVPPIQ